MRVLKSLRVERPNRQASLLWGDDVEHNVLRNVRRLVVVVTECDGFEGSVIAYGVDPEHLDPAHDRPVFEEWMPSAQLDTFLTRLQRGEPAQLAAGTLRTMPVVDLATVEAQVINDPGAIDYPSPRPPTTGPKLHAIFSCVQALVAINESRSAPRDVVTASRTSTDEVS